MDGIEEKRETERERDRKTCRKIKVGVEKMKLRR